LIIRQSASCALAAIANAARTPVLGLFAIVSFLIPLTPVHAQQVTPSPPSESGYKFSVNVDEVVLHATVRNRKGTPVAGLGKDNFQVFEDGVPQTIKHFSHEDIPVTVGLVIDNSGSMRPKRAEVIAAALAFAGSSNPRDQMFLVNFNEHVSFGLPRGTLFTDRPEQLKTAMSTVIADGETALREVVPICERIAHDIRNQYTISYIPTNQKLDGTHRTIQVHATSPGGGRLRVTARAGYIAPSKPAVTTTDATRPEARH